MSNNFSVGNNASLWGNFSSYETYSHVHYYMNLLIVNATSAVAGTLINGWFLAAMLLSPEIRSRLRNKFICGMLVVNLTESAIVCPISAFQVTAFLHEAYHLYNCYIETVHNILYHIEDFVGNWYILILICVYVAQVMNFEPKFTPMWKNISTVVIFISPCVFALLFVPLTMKSYFTPYYEDQCLISTLPVLKVLKSLDTIVPQALASLFLLVTAVLKYRRYPYGRFSDTFHAQLVDDRSQVDAVYPFLALLLTAVASDFCDVLIWMNPQLLDGLHYIIVMRVYVVLSVLTFLRIIFLPVMLLLFPDIRERIKTWRPCRRSTPPGDLVVTYEKNTS